MKKKTLSYIQDLTVNENGTIDVQLQYSIDKTVIHQSTLHYTDNTHFTLCFHLEMSEIVNDLTPAVTSFVYNN